MTAGRINQVSISKHDRRPICSSAGCCYLSPQIQSLSSFRHDLSVGTDSQTSTCPHNVRNECINFALKAAQLELSNREAWSTASIFQSPFLSFVTSFINVGPLRIEQHVEGDKQPTSVTLVGNQMQENKINYFFAIGEHTISTRYIRNFYSTLRIEYFAELHRTHRYTLLTIIYAFIGLECIRQSQRRCLILFRLVARHADNRRSPISPSVARALQCKMHRAVVLNVLVVRSQQ